MEAVLCNNYSHCRVRAARCTPETNGRHEERPATDSRKRWRLIACQPEAAHKDTFLSPPFGSLRRLESQPSRRAPETVPDLTPSPLGCGRCRGLGMDGQRTMVKSSTCWHVSCLACFISKVWGLTFTSAPVLLPAPVERPDSQPTQREDLPHTMCGPCSSVAHSTRIQQRICRETGQSQQAPTRGAVFFEPDRPPQRTESKRWRSFCCSHGIAFRARTQRSTEHPYCQSHVFGGKSSSLKQFL